MGGPVTLIGLRVAPMPSAVAPAVGDDAHRIVCQLPYQSLGESTRAEVQRLPRLYRRPDGGSYDTFAEACTFADLAHRPSAGRGPTGRVARGRVGGVAPGPPGPTQEA